MDLSANHFELFGLPVAFAVDGEGLAARYRELQAETHPDRFANASDQDKRRAQQGASRVNDAFQVLKDPRARARYLLELKGAPVDERRPLPPLFLMEQMELREALEAARNAEDPMEVVEATLEGAKKRLEAMTAELSACFDDGGPEALARAAETVLKMQFIQKLEEDALKLEEEFF
jgi:molecular chaperone HscB